MFYALVSEVVAQCEFLNWQVGGKSIASFFDKPVFQRVNVGLIT